MADILLLDANEVAGRAMDGILARGEHRCIFAQTIDVAWQRLREVVRVDLIFLELDLKGEKGVKFLERLRADPLLKQVPVVVYTTVSDHAVVKQVLAHKVQNYLIKPFVDEYIYREITKARTNPWRRLLFEEERSFCAQMALHEPDLAKMREDLLGLLQRSREFFVTQSDVQDRPMTESRIKTISENAEGCGAWCVVEYLETVQGRLDRGEWSELKRCDEELGFAAQLIYYHLHPEAAPAALAPVEDEKTKEEAKHRAVWMNADPDQTGTMVAQKDVEAALEGLPACPTIDTIAAEFQMNADKGVASQNQVIDLVARDPALTAQVIISANKLDHDEMTVIDDSRTSIGLLGNLKLSALAKTIPTIEARFLDVPPHSWTQLWRFSVGVSRVARFACGHLEMQTLAPQAATAGLVHDIGTLLLVRLYPYALPAILAYAQRKGCTLAFAERKYLGLDRNQMAQHFARKAGLPAAYCNVIHWADAPGEAQADHDLVGIVAIARHLCRINHVGQPLEGSLPGSQHLEQSAAWRFMHERVFPSFNVQKFELVAHQYCAELKQTLAGKTG